MAMDKEKKAEIVTAKLNHLTAWLEQQNDLESLLKRVKASKEIKGAETPRIVQHVLSMIQRVTVRVTV